MIEAFALQQAFRGYSLELPRIAVYISPGWLNPWPIRWELYNLTHTRDFLRSRLICLGVGMSEAIKSFAKDRGHAFDHLPEVPTVQGLKLYKIDYLIAMEKEEGVVSSYARKVNELLGIPVTLRQLLPGM
jgi:hypothetical protein